MSTIAELNAMRVDDFVDNLKDIFEHSPWVAEAVASKRPFADVRALQTAMVLAVDVANDDLQLALIRAHPDLAGKAALAGELTDASTSEQAGAGLDRMDDVEFARFHRLNNEYQEKFGFPFIIAVKGHDKNSILAAFDQRLENSVKAEKFEALRQIAKIAGFRLQQYN